MVGKKILFVSQDNNGNISFNGRPCSFDAVAADRMFDVSSKNEIISQQVSSGYKWEKVWQRQLKKKGFGKQAFYADIEYPSNFEPYFDELHVICWNRDYPGDKKSKVDMSLWEYTGQYEYSGKSHERITEIIYKKKGR